MITRLLASTAAAVLFTGVAMAQMSAPPANNSPADNSSSGQPAPIQTQNPSPRGQLGQAPSSDSTTSQDQATPRRSMSQRMKSSGQKAKSAMTSKRGSKQTAQGHEKDNIADQLNACQSRPQAERQSCIDQATRM